MGTFSGGFHIARFNCQVREDLRLTIYPYREWYGVNRIHDPVPASPSVLNKIFPSYSLTYQSICQPSPHGESIQELHERVAYVLTNIVSQIDVEFPSVKSVLLCTHAATLVAIGRVLTGRMPEDLTEPDFKAFTCGLWTFQRKQPLSGDFGDSNVNQPQGRWMNGRGIGSGWDCIKNGDCSFLEKGRERGW